MSSRTGKDKRISFLKYNKASPGIFGEAFLLNGRYMDYNPWPGAIPALGRVQDGVRIIVHIGIIYSSGITENTRTPSSPSPALGLK
jgi:hypothetical protein